MSKQPEALLLNGYKIYAVGSKHANNHLYNGLSEAFCRNLCTVEDQGEQYSPSSRYIYKTRTCSSHKGIEFGTARAAVQRSIMDFHGECKHLLIIKI